MKNNLHFINKRSSFALSILLLVINQFSAQNVENTLYKQSWEIYKKLGEDSLVYRAAWALAEIGEYQALLRIWDLHEPAMPELTEAQKEHFEKFKPVNALDYLKTRAKKEQIIIVNEAHHQPYHRVFTTEILETLYNAGFRYLGAEAFSNSDLNISTQPYPTFRTGYYLREPRFATLFREAVRIGFTLFPYESINPGDSVPSIREIEQASNIKAILDKDPKAKILIHCGFDHVKECALPGWGKAMAGRLKEYTGIDPFTIDQIRLTEHSDDRFNNPYWKKIGLDYFAFFVDEMGNLFNGPEGLNEYDCRVYLPPTQYIHGRPHWLYRHGEKPYYLNEKISKEFPCLVQAYDLNVDMEVEDPEMRPIPVDIIELKSRDDKKALALKPGKYQVMVNSSPGNSELLQIKVE